MTKLEVAGEDPYQVVSMYVEIDRNALLSGDGFQDRW